MVDQIIRPFLIEMVIERIKINDDPRKFLKTFQMLFKGIVILDNILYNLSLITFQIIVKFGKKS